MGTVTCIACGTDMRRTKELVDAARELATAHSGMKPAAVMGGASVVASVCDRVYRATERVVAAVGDLRERPPNPLAGVIEETRRDLQEAFEDFKQQHLCYQVNTATCELASRWLTNAMARPVAIVDAGPGGFVLAVVPDDHPSADPCGERNHHGYPCERPRGHEGQHALRIAWFP